MRLIGFLRVELEPGESQQVTVTADPRLLARYDGDAARWHIAGGVYRIALGKSANGPVLGTDAPVKARRFGS